MRIKMGDLVKDKDSWYQGRVVARTDYLRGDSRFAVKTAQLHECKPPSWEWFDEDSLELVPDMPVGLVANQGQDEEPSRR